MEQEWQKKEETERQVQTALKEHQKSAEGTLVGCLSRATSNVLKQEVVQVII